MTNHSNTQCDVHRTGFEFKEELIKDEGIVYNRNRLGFL